MKHFLKHLKYPKIELFIIGVVLSYVLFAQTPLGDYISHVSTWGYLGIFIAGLFYSFGFTSPIGIALFLLMPMKNLPLAILIAGISSVIPDLLIYNIAKLSLSDEIEKFEKNKFIRHLERKVELSTTKRVRTIFSYILAIIFIGSPLPDEIGVTMLSEVKELHERIVALISFLAHTIFIAMIIIASH